MTDDLIEPYQASGDLAVTAIHTSGGKGVTDIMSLQWRDRSGRSGQSSRARLINYIEHGGHVFLGGAEGSAAIDATQEEGSGVLRTRGVESSDPDPLLSLPRY
ncbi:MAG TPA: hypothetical protein VKB25_08950 [Conexibacter sp.]|nr:hypothetical protein [Conexibacter sp.]